jgi:hypothetical protein
MSGWTTCCRGRKSACPQLKIEEDFILIKDDYGQIVRMTLEEFEAVVERARDTLRQNSAGYYGLYFPDYLPPQ